MKKSGFSFLSCVISAALAMSPAAYAHNGDVFPGSYTFNQQKNLIFRISASAQTALMNKDVYESALKWNNISSNVHVTIIMETPGMPSITDSMGVYDGKGGYYNGPDIFEDTDLGRIQFFDSNGKQISKHTDSDKISYVKILINTNSSLYDSYYDSLSVKRQAASMNFIHEVGHALMLSHPKQDARLSGHTKNVGKPYAVMNEGLPFLSVKPEVSPTPTSHDTDCLKGKWGV